MQQKKNSALLIVLLLMVGIVLGALIANYGGLGKANLTDMQSYKSSEQGQACVIDANCAEALICDVDTNTCKER